MEQLREDQIKYDLSLTRDEVNELLSYLQPFPRHYAMENIVRKLLALQLKIAEHPNG